MIQWIVENWAALLQVVTGLVTVASIIVKLTPTLKDDSVLLVIVKILGKIALNRNVDDDALRSK